MSDPLALISTPRTFALTELARLRRFLTLGTTGGTYYVGERELTMENAQLVLKLARTRTAEVVAEVLAISTAGRAPRQQPALFALAAAAKLGDDDGRRAALAAVPLVARTGTHLFLFAGYLQQFGGWGRGTRRAIGNWYVDPSRDVENVAYQALKYRQRAGWTHADLLRLSHPKTAEPARRELFNWIHGREAELTGLPLLVAFERIRAASSVIEAADIVALNRGISWEMIPDRFLNEPAVWEALLSNGLPQTALLRQLPRLTRLGLLDPFGEWTARVAAQLSDPERLRKGRVHSINVLVAQRTYASGRGSGGSWSPSRSIVDALDAAFYASFGAVEPTGKRLMLALDVSGSMTQSVSGLPLSCREASAALALVTAATESAYQVVGFTNGDPRSRASRYDRAALTPLAISPRQRLEDAVRVVSDLPFGGTDCALPMRHALAARLEIDTFVVYTDNETWHGDIHPAEALREYRERSGIDARLIVVAMTSTSRSIADPGDRGMLDVSGFDSAVPGLISDFARGL